MKDLKFLADVLKVIAEPNRLKILRILSSGTKCVCQIEKSLKLKQNLVSHHLKVLKNSGLIILKKKGQWRHYSLKADSIKILQSLLKTILKKKPSKSNNC
jgi:ArsR family transcriptional regulator